MGFCCYKLLIVRVYYQFRCKANPHALDNMAGPNKTKSQVPRSKSLDRNKVSSAATNSKFSHAVQNSAFLECRPNLTRTDGQSKASREASKHLSSKLPPSPKVKGPLHPPSQPTHGTSAILQRYTLVKKKHLNVVVKMV